MRHQVTKWLREAGHWGAWRMVSIECGAILGNGEAELPREARPLPPFAAADAAARLVIPVAGAPHDLADPPYLVDLVAAREQGLEGR